MKISQYADDSNFLLKEQESVQNVIKYFENLQKAAGTTINLEKKIYLPIYTDQTSYIKQNLTNITTLQTHQYIEILGINFSKNLKDTIIIN